MSRSIRTFMLLAMVAVVQGASCGGPSGPGNGSVAMSIVIAPDGLTLLVGGQGSLTADVRDSLYAPLPASGVHWSSRNAAIASVAGNGLVTGITVGGTQVIAAYGTEADTVDILVVDALTLQIVPAAATVQVGGTAQFTVVARNAAGQLVSIPPPVWASGNPAVGLVVGGLAVGVSVGSTPITASVGAVTSPSALLTVGAVALECDGIENTAGWDVTLSYSYAVGLTNGDDEQLSLVHSGSVTAILAPLFGVLPAISWEGPLQGSVTMNDRKTDLNSSPVVVHTLVGTGAPVTGSGRSVFRLSVDLETCTYDFAVSPFGHVTLTTTGSTSETGDLPLGNLQASDPLGAWKTLGMSALDESFDAHFILAANRTGKNTYYPFGVGQLLWANNGSLDAPQGAATVDYVITKR